VATDDDDDVNKPDKVPEYVDQDDLDYIARDWEFLASVARSGSRDGAWAATCRPWRVRALSAASNGIPRMSGTHR
jgi:hypothetical protein